MPRQFITRSDVDAVADAGHDELIVDEKTTVTDIAREHARGRGVRLVRQPSAIAATTAVPEAPPAAQEPRSEDEEEEDLAALVRSIVVGRLGHAPAGLDAAVHRVLGQEA